MKEKKLYKLRTDKKLNGVCGGGVADPVGAGEIRKQLSKGKKQR